MSIEIKQNKTTIKSSYRPEIDGLRAFAVVAVIINHFNKEILPGGYLGVDIFFVISGYVITSSLYQRHSKNFKDFISGFYERRIKRLVPAISIFVLITSIAICLFNPYPILSLRTGLTGLLGFSNLYLLKHSTDYFAQSTELNVFTHTWSLGVEEQFYVLFPFLIWFSGFGRQTKNGARNLFLIVGALAIASLIGYLYLYTINQSAAYFLMPTRFWEIAAGCLLFITFQKRTYIENFLAKVPPLLVLVLIIGIMYLPMSLATISTVTVVVLSLVLIACLKKGTASYKFFTDSRVVYIGLISYSLYLWHWGVLSISRWTIGIHWWSIPFQLALMLGLAICSYRYIETPLRRGNWFGKRWKTFIVGGGLIFTLSGVLIALDIPLKGQLYIGKKINHGRPNFLRGDECLENVSKNTRCFLIENISKRTLWMLGDSQTQMLALAGEKVANSFEINLKLYSILATPFPSFNHYKKFKGYNKNIGFIDDLKLLEKELYKKIKVGDIILLTLYNPGHFGGEYIRTSYSFISKDGSIISQEDYFNAWISSVANLASFAEKEGAKVIIQTPTPEWSLWYQKKNTICSSTAIQWFNRTQKGDCQIISEYFVDKKTGVYNHQFEKLNKLSTSHSNIYLFDTYKITCPQKTCYYSMDGIDIYADDAHLSYIWARDFLAPEISKFINEIQTMDK